MDGTVMSASMTYLDGDSVTAESKNDASREEVSLNEEEPGRSHVYAERETQVLQESSIVFFYIHIALFAVCGCLFRILTDEIFGEFAKVENKNGVISHSFLSNLIACFVLGAVNASSLRETKLAALYEGLVTGFCGTYSTWSAWNQQQSMLVVGETTCPSVNQVLAVISWFVGFYAFLGSYRVGRDFGKMINGRSETRVIRRGRMIAHASASIIFILAFTGFVIVILLDVAERVKSIFLCLLFAPFAACLRNWLSKFRVDKKRLPLGMLVTNFSGAVFASLLHVIVTRLAPYQCDGVQVCWPAVVMFALEKGFCDSLTTLSAIISEFYFIKRENPVHAYVYLLLTVFPCQIITGIGSGVNFALM